MITKSSTFQALLTIYEDLIVFSFWKKFSHIQHLSKGMKWFL